MRRRLRPVFWFESALAMLASAVCFLTLILPTWIERTLGFEPDGGSGSTEWGFVAALGAAALVAAVSARSEWRRSTPATA